MRGPNYNPVIGYLLIDKEKHVLGPPGEARDVAYHSAERAQQAAVEYGYEGEVGQIAPLHLGGILSVVWGDVGDIYLDGAGATALIRACKRRGIAVKRAAKKRVKRQEVRAVYSSRALLGDGPGEQVF